MSQPISARRTALQKLELPGAHVGLALDVLLEAQNAPDKATALLDAVAEKCGPDAAYEAAFTRWKAALEKSGAALLEAELVAPLAIGLGNAAPLEVGLSLHRTYGLPLLPGSALKGLCRRMANRANLSEEQRKYLLGATDSASGITFWDGWLSPATKCPFKRDVVTVHHPDYYGAGGKSGFPTDFDDPIPISFLAVRPGAKFVLALSAPSPEWGAWLQSALELLRAGLENEGLGAKTNAGYGRFRCRVESTPIIGGAPGANAAGEELPPELQRQIENIKGPQDFSGLLAMLEALPHAAQKTAALRLQERFKALNLWKAKNAEKQFYKWILEKLKA